MKKICWRIWIAMVVVFAGLHFYEKGRTIWLRVQQTKAFEERWGNGK